MKRNNVRSVIQTGLFSIVFMLLTVFTISLTSCNSMNQINISEEYRFNLSASEINSSSITDEEELAFLETLREDSSISKYVDIYENLFYHTNRFVVENTYKASVSSEDEIDEQGNTNVQLFYDVNDFTFKKGKMYIVKQFDTEWREESAVNIPLFSEFYQANTFDDSMLTQVEYFAFEDNNYLDYSAYSETEQSILSQIDTKMRSFLAPLCINSPDPDYVYIFTPTENMQMISVLNGTSAGSYSYESINTDSSKSNNYGWYIYEYGMEDIISPDFTNQDYCISTNVDDPFTIDEILSQIYAYDDVDGNLSDEVELVSTTYDSVVLVLGTHDFVVSVSDSAGNIAQATFYIVVYDIVKPAISGTDNYTVLYDSPLSIDTILAGLSASDNFTQGLTITLKSDTYTASQNIVGNYNMVFTTTDSAENISDDFIVSISVIDNKTPIITAPSIIEVSYTKKLDLSDIKPKISVVDEYDGNIENYSILSFDDYLKNYSKPGQYILTISAEDSSGNKTNANITLKVKDGISPEFYIAKDFVISVAKGTELTKEMIISYLSQIGEIEANNVESVSYELDSTKVGVYAVAIQMKDDTTYTCSIQVGDVESNDNAFNFMDLFTKAYWETAAANYVSDLFSPTSWNALHYLTIFGILWIIVSIILVIKTMKSKKNKGENKYERRF